MKIGNIDFGAQPLFLAPMEDVTDASFRLLCREFGADLVYTEFVSADALIRSVGSQFDKMRVHSAERPVAIQIYGRDVASMVEAARIAEREGAPDILDLNFGCPVKRVAGKGAGSGLLRDVPLMLAITRAVADAVSVPLTVKTRLGWDHSSIIIEELVLQLQEAGAQAITIHGRTRAQMYKGEADWDPIYAVAAHPEVKVPIIGNGDITDGATALRHYTDSQVSALMIGRATIGRPWVFEEVRSALSGVPAPQHPPQWYMDVLLRQLHESIARLGEMRGITHIRRHLAVTPLFRGIPDFRNLRIEILRAPTLSLLEPLLGEALSRIEASGTHPITGLPLE